MEGITMPVKTELTFVSIHSLVTSVLSVGEGILRQVMDIFMMKFFKFEQLFNRIMLIVI
jgi:hypothetical protein